ncbi:MAG: hypothetical protein C4576_16130, partial [Desulfobacteraceae bacterium]
GIVLKPAVDVANGKMLFRDTFSQYGALTILVQAFAIKLFGSKLIVIRLLTASVYGIIVVVQWLIFARILSIRASTIASAIWFGLAYFLLDFETMIIYPASTVFPICSFLLGVYFLLLYIERRRLYYAMVCGLVTACTFWMKTNFGIIQVGTMLPVLILLEFNEKERNCFRLLVAFLVGNCAIHLYFVTWLYVNQAFGDFWIQSIEFGYIFARKCGSLAIESFWINLMKCLLPIDTKHGFVSKLWVILPIASCLMSCRMCFTIVQRRPIALSGKIAFAISGMSTGLWFTYYPINSVYHMWMSSALSVGVLISVISGITGSIRGHGRSIIRFSILFVLFYSDISLRATESISKISRFRNYVKIEKPAFLAGMYVPSNEAIVYDTLDELRRVYSEYGVINMTKDGLFALYDVNSNSFHKMYVNWRPFNAQLYPEYSSLLQWQIASKSNIIISNEIENIEGYERVAIFPRVGKGDMRLPVVFYAPLMS